jgi:hypothetical protein
MKRKLVDLADVFDAQGRSALTNAHLQGRVDELEAEVDRLKRLLEAQVRARQHADEQVSVPPTLN